MIHHALWWPQPATRCGIDHEQQGSHLSSHFNRSLPLPCIRRKLKTCDNEAVDLNLCCSNHIPTSRESKLIPLTTPGSSHELALQLAREHCHVPARMSTCQRKLGHCHVGWVADAVLLHIILCSSECSRVDQKKWDHSRKRVCS